MDAIIDAPVHGVITYFPNVTLYPIGGDPLSVVPTDMETAFYTPAGIVDGFTKKYKVDKLVYFEKTNDINSAILFPRVLYLE